MVVDPLAELYASCDVGWSKAKRHPATSLTSSPLDGDETEGLPGFVATWKKEGTSAVEGPSTLLERATGFRAYRISRQCHRRKEQNHNTIVPAPLGIEPTIIKYSRQTIGTYPRRCRYADIGLAGPSHQS